MEERTRQLGSGGLDLADAEEVLLLGLGLPRRVTVGGRGRDPLERNVLESLPGGVDLERLSEGEDTLLDTGARALDHDEVLVDNTVVREATERGDALLGGVELSRGRSLVSTVGDAVDLLAKLGTVVVTVLTGSGNGEHDVRRVPGTDTGDLTETTVGLPGKLLGAPTSSNTLVTVTLGNGDDVNGLVLLEDRLDVNGLLEVLLGEVNLVRDGATVDLDLHQVRLLLLEASLADLGVGKDTDDRAVLLDALELTGDRLTVVLGVLLGVLGEGLLLRAVPVLVESALELVRKVLSPDGGERAETTGSLDVADNTDGNHGGSLDDSNSLDDLLLVHLGTRSVKVTDDVGHTSLVAEHGSEVDGLLGVVLGESLYLSAVPSGTLTGQETQRTVTRVLELCKGEMGKKAKKGEKEKGGESQAVSAMLHIDLKHSRLPLASFPSLARRKQTEEKEK